RIKYNSYFNKQCKAYVLAKCIHDNPHIVLLVSVRKSDGNHVTKDCKTITPDMESPLFKCYNCSCSLNLPHDHKANDVDCPFRAKYIVAKE
ncbi:hypothetical protein Bhyg_08421, partial [Pseudolycoriella hygida]